MEKHYTVSDGTLVLYLWPAEEGGYDVTSPFDPALITQAATVEEAFLMAYDAQESLRQARAKRFGPASEEATQDSSSTPTPSSPRPSRSATSAGKARAPHVADKTEKEFADEMEKRIGMRGRRIRFVEE